MKTRMDLSQVIDDYIKETIDHSLGLPISIDVLRKKLQTVEESQKLLQEQNVSLVSSLKEKDKVIDRVRSEASLNAQALKRFVAGNQNLASQCKKLEKECVLYHQDREALMEFGNECEERAADAESKVRELEQEVEKLKDQSEEDLFLDSVLTSFMSDDEEATKCGRIFWESNIQDQSHQILSTNWDELKLLSRNVVSLVSMVKKLEKEKECLILNLAKAEEEVELVSIQNKELVRENSNLLKQFRSPNCSAEKVKSNKRKSHKIDFSSSGSIRYC